MTSDTLQNELEEAVHKLLDLARELTWNRISNNCKFIFSEIRNSDKNFFEQQRETKKENDKKVPVSLQDLKPTLQKHYNNIYDINLYVYKSTKKMTVIDIRYYPKSSLDDDYRRKVIDNPPMLHCKVSNPPWLFDNKEKFDINWKHNILRYKWKMFWLRLQLKTKSG